MIFDIIVLAVLLVSALHAFWRGFIREILTIFGAIGGVFAALAFGDDVRPLMEGWLGIEQGAPATKLFDAIPMSLIATLLSYGVVFIIVFGVLSFISYLIAEQVRALGLGAVDRTLGVVFGLARGLLILGIFYLPIHVVMDDKTKDIWFKESKTHVVIVAVSNMIERFMPVSFLSSSERTADKKEKDDQDPTSKIVGGVLDQINTIHSKPTMTPPSSSAVSSPKPEGYDPASRDTLEKLIEKTP